MLKRARPPSAFTTVVPLAPALADPKLIASVEPEAPRVPLIGVLALGIIALSVFMLERGRAGLVITDLAVGTTPATMYQQPGSAGPLMVVAHGFSGSRQLMQADSLALAQSGYSVLAFDFEGHGRNPVPVSGDAKRDRRYHTATGR